MEKSEARNSKRFGWRTNLFDLDTPTIDFYDPLGTHH
jgi:hypothetical protein